MLGKGVMPVQEGSSRRLFSVKSEPLSLPRALLFFFFSFSLFYMYCPNLNHEIQEMSS